MAELFYDQGYGLSGGDSVIARIHGDDLFHDYTFKIPRNVRYLRFDPLTTAGTVLINKVEITDRFGKVLKSFTPHQMSPELTPANQIKAFEFLDEGLKVTTEDKADDPQINVLLNEASIQQIHARTILSGKKTLMEWSLTFVLLIVSIVIWKKYKERICRFIEGSFFQEKLPLMYLGCALGLILAMAFISGLDVHPDEMGHANSASYYSDSWLLPSVDDPKVLKTISGFGISYLFRVDIVYFLSGKFALLLSGLVNDNYLRLRLFNVMLFLVLVLIVARKIRSVPLLVLALVLSPMGGGRGAATPEALAARIAAISKLHDAFVSDLLSGIIPHVDSTYRVLTSRENRAIAGLSMGGAETLRTAPSNLDKFAWIGVFSMGLQEGVNAGVNSDFVERNAAFFADPEKTNKLVKLFWIGVGKDDRTVTDGPKRLSETLTAHNIRHEFHETEGGHDWINWRMYLRDFTPLLFR